MDYVGLGLIALTLGLLAFCALRAPKRLIYVSLVAPVFILIGLVLVFREQITEITIEDVGSIKMAKKEATDALDEITKVRKQVVAQAARIEDLASQATDALAIARSASQRAELVQAYSFVARWGTNGRVAMSRGITGTGPLTGWARDTVRLSGAQLTADCNRAPQLARVAIQRIPQFGAPHLVLAHCLKQSGDPSWRATAETAIRHLEAAVSIPGHHEDQNRLLEISKRLLAD